MKTQGNILSVLCVLFLTFVNGFSTTEQVFFDDFESSAGWIRNPFCIDDATTGMWERDNPEETVYDVTMQLDVTVSGLNCLVTGPLAGSGVGSYDIDDGKTTVRSPNITLPSEGDITLSFSYYLAHYSNSSSDDYLRVKVVGSTTQLVLEELGAADVDEAVWETFSTSLNDFKGQSVYILIEAADEAGASLVEAGIDDVYILKGTCLAYPPCYQPGPWDSEAGDSIATRNNVQIGTADMNKNLTVDGEIYCNWISPRPDEDLNIFCTKIQNPTRQRLDITSSFGELFFPEIECDIFDAYTVNIAGPLTVAGGTQFSGDMKINGELWARKVTVTLDEFPDYVFTKDYPLMPLAELEKFIHKNGHLPGIPNEKEVKESGVEIGAMQAKLLEKIEEMSLYLIELTKENKALKERIDSIKRR